MNIVKSWPMVREFLLLGFSEVWLLQLIHATLSLLVYLAAFFLEALFDGSEVFLLTAMSYESYVAICCHLRYGLIMDRGLLEVQQFFWDVRSPRRPLVLGRTLSLIPVSSLATCRFSKEMANLMAYWSCVPQVFLVILFSSSELFILMVMSYDRYMAICHLLCYVIIVDRGAFVKMAKLKSFYGHHEVQQFFCDVRYLLKASSSETHVVINAIETIGGVFGFISFVPIVVPYACIFRATTCRFSKKMANLTVVTEFLLLGFSKVRELQLVHAALFFLVYLATLSGNLLIVAVTALDRRLHTPMYFFLRNLSVLDLCLISVTVPQSIHNSLTNQRSISYWGCVAQVFLVALFAGSELFLLTAMSYDRYVAICHPLRYGVIVDRGTCIKMAAASWLSAGLFGVVYTAGTFSLGFCGHHEVQQFFCDVLSLLKASRSGNHVVIDVSKVIGAVLGLISFVSIVVSYVRIFRAVLRMPAAEGRAKAFSTCLPHITVVTFFLSTAAIAYLKPVSDSPSTLDLLVSVFYTMVPPALNPLLYSLRNRDMKAALGRVLGRHQFLNIKRPLSLP
ncbi:olfactory receptor 14A16-like [Tachyglossus aculeatus]|uniref:olfactory receptor 14A16-like n=1 Tax=Tachyglossus aculeatus TaxID=9261 RepID=UPI0018F2D0C6|nr:olfactory receptor 14A16-like [Tachyglossus aculeatus]